MRAFVRSHFFAWPTAFLLVGVVNAGQPFALTYVFDIGGGGCIGETRIYGDAAVAQVMASHRASDLRAIPKSDKAWKRLDRALGAMGRNFLTTIGCAADRVAVSLDGTAHVLDQIQVRRLGAPVTYFNDLEGSPRVRIDALALLHSIYFPGTECTQDFHRVRVHIDFNGAKLEVTGLATAGCP
jgi:hypothetical protein